MPSHPFDFEIQSDLFSTPEMTAIFSERQRFTRWLGFEAALAEAQAELGIIPREAAQEIATKANLDCLDLEAVRKAYRQSRNSLMPLINGLRRACVAPHGEYTHYGATTQDVIDTSQVLELRDTFRIIYRDLRKAEEFLLLLAQRHCATPMLGRTHGQQALPITFGLKCSVWLAELRRHIERVKSLMPRISAGQLSGAVGTYAALGHDGREIAKRTLAKLGLSSAPVSWHNSRDNMAEAATLMAMISTTLEKIASEIFELGKNEVGELFEPAPPGKASSSTMPHKRNPVICQRIAVLARQARALSATVVESMLHEHERDGRALWSEWLAMPQISVYTGTALNYSLSLISGLGVNSERMLKNLRCQGESLLSEWLQFRLAARMGKMRAQEKLSTIIAESHETGMSVRDCLRNDQETAAILSEEDYTFMEYPEKYTGLAESIIRDQVADLFRRRNLEPCEL